MEFQTNKGTLMPSSVSENLIMQLGYLQNYAMKGHFLTSEIVLDIRCCLFPDTANLKSLHFTPLCLQGMPLRGSVEYPEFSFSNLENLGGVQVFLLFSANLNEKTACVPKLKANSNFIGMARGVGAEGRWRYLMPNSPPSPSLKIQSALNNSLVLQLV